MSEPTTARRIERLMSESRKLGLSLYLFIDEYDNFANNILVNAGREAHRELTHSPIQTSFPAEGLLRQDNFVSLL